MDKILLAINEYSARIYGHTYDYVCSHGDKYYSGCFGLVTIYYTIIDGKLIDSMVD